MFGAIGDFYRPTNLYKHKPSPYAFVRYFRQEDADNAVACMDGKEYGEYEIRVFEANKQNSFFTQDTGFITNEAFDTPKVSVDNFRADLPESHFEMRRRQELLLKTNVFAVRVDDIPPEIR